MPAEQIVLFIIGTIGIIVAAYYATYFLSVKSIMPRRAAGRSIILRERFAIAKDKSFCLVEVKGRVYVIGITNNNVTLLDTIDAEEFAAEDMQQNNQMKYNTGITGVIAAKLEVIIRAAIKRMRGEQVLNAKETRSFAQTYEEATGVSEKRQEQKEAPSEKSKRNAK